MSRYTVASLHLTTVCCCVSRFQSSPGQLPWGFFTFSRGATGTPFYARHGTSDAKGKRGSFLLPCSGAEGKKRCGRRRRESYRPRFQRGRFLCARMQAGKGCALDVGANSRVFARGPRRLDAPDGRGILNGARRRRALEKGLPPCESRDRLFLSLVVFSQPLPSAFADCAGFFGCLFHFATLAHFALWEEKHVSRRMEEEARE